MSALQGDSANITEAGVIGIHTAPNGRGVYGESKNGHGVWGWSEAASGVTGDSVNGNGVYGQSQKNDGVLGITTATGKAGVAGVNDVDGNGVYGRSKMGNGVVGSSSSTVHAGVAGTNDNPSGVGVYGKGGRLAAYFEGKVQITEDLTVKGVSIQAMVQLIQQLQNQVKVLEQKVNSTPAPTPTSTTPQINVKIESSKFVVTGSGFLANKIVNIRVADDAFRNNNFSQSADSSGKLNAILTIPCNSGIKLHFSANDSRPNTSDITGVLWSNTVTITCP